MKLQGKAVDGFLRKPDPRIRAVLFYGPDLGLVRDRAKTLARAIVPDLADPFRAVDLTGKALTEDPARLADETAALSLTGGRRVVLIREAEDPAASVFAALFAAWPPGDTLIVVESGDLAARSKLRALFEGEDRAAAVPCYVEDSSSLESVIADLLKENGLGADADVVPFLAQRLVGDRMVARSEIEKLALYALGRNRLTLADVEACIGDSSALEPDEPVLAAAEGDYAALDRALARLFAEGTAPVAILRTAQRHFQRLQLVAAQVERGGNVDAAVEQLKPPVFFKLKRRFANQARRWPAPLVRSALERLVDAEADVKRTGIPDQTVCARVLYQLASMARR
jgi:DNA polymerase III subunit delta